MVGSDGHARAREFLAGRLAQLRLESYPGAGAADFALPYCQEGQEFFNLVGVVPGLDRRARPVLLGAHYDSVIAAPCADDNAAARAITLAGAEALRQAPVPPARDVVVAFFDAEEPPYFLSAAMGSLRFVLDQMDGRGVSLALIQDLTGHDVSLPLPVLGATALPHLRDLLFMTGAESHPRLPGLVRAVARPIDLPLVATLTEHVGDMSDPHAFRDMGIPYLFFSCGRSEHYHQPSDTPEKLAYPKMARIAAFLTGVTRAACAAGDLSRAEGKHDTAGLEISLLREALGPALLPVLLRLAGVGKLRGRADLDRIVGLIAGTGL